jgi:hypothetical protein
MIHMGDTISRADSGWGDRNPKLKPPQLDPDGLADARDIKHEQESHQASVE